MKVAILISGHLRNLHEIIDNLYCNLLDPIKSEKNYYLNIYIHTWDNNFTCDKTFNHDNNYENIKIDEEYLTNLFKSKNIILKKIIIENQENIKNKINLIDYLKNNTKEKSIHNNFDNDYVQDLTKKLFFQFYGHYKVLEMCDLDCDFIIKTRPDMIYEKFDIKLFEQNLFFPNSHQKKGCNINQLFFGGKTEYMISILKYFENCIYNKINFELINKYHATDINFNQIFRYYIINVLNYKQILFFTDYNPKIYRNKNKIVKVK